MRTFGQQRPERIFVELPNSRLSGLAPRYAFD